jgi:hypothetical protein
MPALAGPSWFALAGLGLAGMLGGYVLRHLWGIQADRANASRVSALCDQLDVKDSKLQGLRIALQAEQARVRELQAELEPWHAVEDRRIRTQEGCAALDNFIGRRQ